MSGNKILVLGKLQNGQRFRPSDWIERLASCGATYETNQRLTWHDFLRPIHIENEKCLLIDSELESANPFLWNYVIDFARANKLQIRECGSASLEAGYGPDQHAAA